jgi:hypothetical protein
MDAAISMNTAGITPMKLLLMIFGRVAGVVNALDEVEQVVLVVVVVVVD